MSQFTKEIRDEVKKFLINEVNETNYPVIDSTEYSRKDLNSKTDVEWNMYFAYFEDLYQYIMKNGILKHPSELINPVKTPQLKRQRTIQNYANIRKPDNPVNSVKTVKEGKPGQVYRASSQEYYDREKNKYIPYPGKSQPIWFALDESVTRIYHEQNKKNIMFSNIIKDYTGDSSHKKRKRDGTHSIPRSMEEQNMQMEDNVKKDLRLMNLDGTKIEECRNVYELNVVLMQKLYNIVTFHLDLKSPLFLVPYGLGHKKGLRNSFYDTDRILTIEFMIIFKILNDYIFIKNNPPILILGYYHSNASTSTEKCSYMGAEVTINADIIDKIRIFDPTGDVVYKIGSKKPFTTSKPTGGKPPRNKSRFTRKKKKKT